MKNKASRISWPVFLIFSIIFIILFFIFNTNLQARKKEVVSEYTILQTNINDLQKKLDSLKQDLITASTNNSVVTAAKAHGYLATDEMVVYIHYPDDFNESQIYIEERFNPTN